MTGRSTSKIKILHTIRQGQIGGGETHVLDLVSNLNKDKFTSEVLSFTDGEMVSRLKKMGVPCHVIPTTRPFDFSVWGSVKKLMLENKYDLVHAHGTRACSNSFSAANKLGLPLAYTIHGWSFHQDQSTLVRNVRELSEKFLVNKTTRNISVSESNNNDGIERLGMPNSQIVNYGVNLEKFNASGNYELNRQDLSLPDDKILVGMVVRLTIQKDPLTFLKAAKVALKKSKNLHFVVVGGGELEPKCRDYVSKHNLGQDVTFVGFRTDVPAVLNLLDIYCLPSLWEGLPIGVLEAMAMAKAIVATPVDGTKEVIKHDVSGLLFPEYDSQKMAACILDLANNNSKRKKVGENALSKINESFTVGRMADEIGDLYMQLYNSKKKELA
ncbi:glycosyltransferase family 4 protein [Owenweeksia hongkongensis]|uniref:glycosyltransferase family 4 protein n=1 Tax=Owenweeksia hongkongensis TaxID=253245 RepID=UPI003A8F023F